LTERFRNKPLFGFNLRGKTHWEKDDEFTTGDLIDQPWIGFDLNPIDWEPIPGLSKSFEKGGWSAAFKHIKRKLWRKKK